MLHQVTSGNCLWRVSCLGPKTRIQKIFCFKKIVDLDTGLDYSVDFKECCCLGTGLCIFLSKSIFFEIAPSKKYQEYLRLGISFILNLYSLTVLKNHIMNVTESE